MSELPILVLREPESEQDELLGVLREAQRLVFKYPVAAQGIARAFVEEGRRFAQTEDGEAWRAHLAASDLLKRGRALWDVGTLGSLRERSETTLPTVMVDAFVQAAASGDIESLLAAFVNAGKNQ
jgi:hypothetical protein